MQVRESGVVPYEITHQSELSGEFRFTVAKMGDPLVCKETTSSNQILRPLKNPIEREAGNGV
jgi:hypothetical protein